MSYDEDYYRRLEIDCGTKVSELRDELDTARLEVERLRGLIGLSYGYLWHVNNEHGTPQRFYPPERAAYEARKLLRDTLTHEQRGQYINSVRELIDEALAAQQEKKL